ncbi:MAG TPA: RNA 2',3'-cyclic phosphodiesterase [Verrucomicrobiae bacterium]|nr:RNA 2',3'-cyclic phosphodiesterase [Verrucomicrobiae bacterium]
MNPEFLRLFVAISIPETIRRQLAIVQDQLRPLATTKDVRWTSPEQMHLTLKFLGNVPTVLVEDVKKSIAAACLGVGPFQLCVFGIGFFPDVLSPRVIWVGFSGQPALINLQLRISESLAGFGKSGAPEKFLPHATLGRFQKFRRHKTEKLLEWATKFDEKLFGEFCAGTVELFHSETLPSGARHTVLSSFQLETK